MVSVEKIYNSVLYEKFLVELNLMLDKYKTFPFNRIVKHLFHGTTFTDPSLIYKSEDMPFKKPGIYGKGIYFIEQFSDSDGYAYNVKNS